MESKLVKEEGYVYDPVPTTARDCNNRARTRTWRVMVALVLGLSLFAWRMRCYSFRDKVLNMADDVVGSSVWGECPQPALPGTQCGYVVAPLDYFNSSAGVAYVTVSRYPATVQPRKGSVLFNPGGPGGAGMDWVKRGGDLLQSIIGEDWDIIGFDPRGIGRTMPSTRCFENTTFAEFKRNTVLERSYDIAGNVSTHEARSVLLQSERASHALLKAEMEICKESMGEQLRYMGTSTVVRDIDFLTKVIEGEDALINFYGASYGTILGQYLVNMLPDRVGRIMIDGVADAVAWASKPYYTWYRSWLSSTSDTYQTFLTRCGEVGPDVCALAHKEGDLAEDIETRIEDFIDSLYYQPLDVPFANSPGSLTAGIVRMYLLEALESPSNWETFAHGIAAAMNGDGSIILNNGPFAASRDLERSAVSCNDNLPFAAPAPETVIAEALDVYNTVSRFVFSVITTEPDAGCQYWKIPPPPERFEGPWNHTLRNPMLVVSNTADPVTPISSGRLVQKLLGDSARLLVQDGPGHCSLALHSTCTVDAMRAYFKDGTLPEPGTVCPLDAPPFEPQLGSSVRPGREDTASRHAALADLLHNARKGRLSEDISAGMFATF